MEKQNEKPLYEVSEGIIRQALDEQWGMSHVAKVLEVKKTVAGRMVFRIDTEGKVFALKVYAPSRANETVRKDIFMLRFLEKLAFPASIVRDTKDGEGYGTISGSYAYVSDWIEEENPESTEDTFEKLGRVTGRLHGIKEPYPHVSDFSPAQEVQKLLVTARSKGIDQKYVDLLLSIRDVSQLPQGIIHTDIGPHNSRQRSNGELVVIDWEDAGLGPMIIDLGWELEQCLSNESVFETEKAKALLRGYEKHRKLTEEEKRHAYDAALFFAFLYWMDEQKEFGARRIDWLATHRNEFEKIFE